MFVIAKKPTDSSSFLLTSVFICFIALNQLFAETKGSQTKSTEKESITFSASVDEMKIEKNRIIISPGRNRRSARYSDYIFPDKKNFEVKHGFSWNGTKSIDCLVQSKSARKFKPEPYMQSPQGGFHITEIICDIPSYHAFEYHKNVFGEEPGFNSHGIAKVLKKDGWYAVDREGKVLHKIFTFDNGPDYESEDLYRIVLSGKMGFADTRGKTIIKPKYDFVTPFENGKAKYCQGCKLIKMGEHSQYKGGDWGEIKNPLLKK